MKIDKIWDSSKYKIINKDLIFKKLGKTVVAEFKRDDKIVLLNMASIYKDDDNTYKIYISDNQLDTDFNNVTIRTRDGYDLIDIFMSKDEFMNFFGMLAMKIKIN